MAKLNMQKVFRLVSIVVIIALMFGFANTMAQSFYTSMRCITDMTVVCDAPSNSGDTQIAANTNGDASSDEWLCSVGETGYCQSNQTEGYEVALKN